MWYCFTIGTGSIITIKTGSWIHQALLSIRVRVLPCIFDSKIEIRAGDPSLPILRAFYVLRSRVRDAGTLARVRVALPDPSSYLRAV